MALRLRDLTDEERTTIERLAHSRTAPARLVERARIIWYADQKLRVPAIAGRLASMNGRCGCGSSASTPTGSAVSTMRHARAGPLHIQVMWWPKSSPPH